MPSSAEGHLSLPCPEKNKNKKPTEKPQQTNKQTQPTNQQPQKNKNHQTKKSLQRHSVPEK